MYCTRYYTVCTHGCRGANGRTAPGVPGFWTDRRPRASTTVPSGRPCAIWPTANTPRCNRCLTSGTVPAWPPRPWSGSLTCGPAVMLRAEIIPGPAVSAGRASEIFRATRRRRRPVRIITRGVRAPGITTTEPKNRHPYRSPPTRPVSNTAGAGSSGCAGLS